MSLKRFSMRKIRELLRLKYELGRSHREIAASLGIANGTVSDYVRRARAAGFSWQLPEGLDDAALKAALFPPPPPSRVRRPEPDWGGVHLCGRDPEPCATGLDDIARPDVRVLGRGARARDP